MAETKLKTQALAASESWHAVGAAGEPAFANSWVNFGGTWNVAGFYKNIDGTVFVKGLIKDGTISTTLPVFTLPVGYRPLEAYIISTQGNAAFGEICLYGDGKVCAATGNNTYFSINFSFRAEQ